MSKLPKFPLIVTLALAGVGILMVIFALLILFGGILDLPV